MKKFIDSRLLVLTALVTFGFQILFFITMYLSRLDSLLIFAGSINLMILAVLTFTLGGAYEARQIVLTTCVLAWGTRMFLFFMFRAILSWRDRSTEDKVGNIYKLLFFRALRAIFVWCVALPVTITNSKSSEDVSVPSTLDYVGWGLFTFGFLFEAIADIQKVMFRQLPESVDHWTDVGVWTWSRHPDFFGEILVWLGIYISSLVDFEGLEHVAFISPLFMILFIAFVSGIPDLELAANRHHGHKDDYHVYKSRTSILLPFPPFLYSILPEFLRRTVLFDLKLYDSSPPPIDEEEGRMTVQPSVERTSRSSTRGNSVP